MSASLRHCIIHNNKRTLGFQLNCLMEKHICYVRNFFPGLLSLRPCSSDTQGNIVTRHSKVTEEIATFLEENNATKNGYTNYRNHPGNVRRNRSQIPSRLFKAIKILLERYPVKTMESEIEKLNHYLHHRQLPVSDVELTRKSREIERKIIEKDGDIPEDCYGLELEKALEERQKKVFVQLRKIVYHWKPMQYDAFTSYIYLLGNMAKEYAIILQCFTEISKRDPNFRPTSVYNFGSKVGSAVWAADKLWSTIGEFYCVDTSVNMHTISQLLLQDGNEQNKVFSIKGVHFRQFEPSSNENKFSLVVSKDMLIEEPTRKDRLQLVDSLWNMTNTYLVLIEYGTGAGFTLINEARDYLIQQFSNPQQESLRGHIFAPCPRDKPCPKAMKNMFCFAESVVNNQDFTSPTDQEKPKTLAKYSYLIVKKGERDTANRFPRVLHEKKASKHTHLHLCLPCGVIQHAIVSKSKYEKHLYGCARYARTGDFLPVALSDEAPADETSLDQGTDVNDHEDASQVTDLEPEK